MVWTQAGSGVVHDEFPAQAGCEVHGVQIFANLSAKNKALPPRMLHVAANEVPAVMDTVGNRTRVLSGSFSGAKRPVQPAESFDLLDVRLEGEWKFPTPAHRNTLTYVLCGNVEVRTGGDSRTLQTYEALAARNKAANELVVFASAGGQILLLSGSDPGDPITVYGPFVMNDESQLASAFERYRKGEMDRLLPLAASSFCYGASHDDTSYSGLRQFHPYRQLAQFMAARPGHPGLPA